MSSKIKKTLTSKNKSTSSSKKGGVDLSSRPIPTKVEPQLGKKDSWNRSRDKRQIEIARNKEDILEALYENNGLITIALTNIGVAPTAYYAYLRDDSDFRERSEKIIRLVKERNLDFVESKLFSNIKSEKEASIFFYLKCQGRGRGFIERSDLNFSADIDKPIVPTSLVEQALSDLMALEKKRLSSEEIA